MKDLVLGVRKFTHTSEYSDKHIFKCFFSFHHCRQVVIRFSYFRKLIDSSLAEPAEQRGPCDELLCLIALYYVYIAQSGGLIPEISLTKISAFPFCYRFMKCFGRKTFVTYGMSPSCKNEFCQCVDEESVQILLPGT